MKRIIDIVASLSGLIFLSPVLIVFMYLIWRQDGHSPFYIAPRVGKDGHLFNMVKLRSMIVGADKTGVDSTSSSDARITPVGIMVRRYKLDEFTQLWNVLKGDMSLVGPRPNVKRETDLYTHEEQKLLSVAPGVTDFASIVFSDENEILKDCEDPDIGYNQLIRPWKSRLGIFYVDKRNLIIDLALIIITAVAIISRKAALKYIHKMLKILKAPNDLISVSKRNSELVPFAPPGSDDIVMSR